MIIQGEWKAVKGFLFYKPFITVESPKGMVIAICDKEGWDCHEERLDNAYLIAASKDMYEALKSMTGYLTEQKSRRHKKSFADQRAGSDAEDLLLMVEAAIAKAEGKS